MGFAGPVCLKIKKTVRFLRSEGLKTLNCYPREYLELWEIKDIIVKTIGQANDIKRQWKQDGFTCARRLLNFSGLGYGYSYRVFGLRDKTGKRT